MSGLNGSVPLRYAEGGFLPTPVSAVEMVNSAQEGALSAPSASSFEQSKVPPSPKSFRCQHCNRAFPVKDRLRQHCDDSHLGCSKEPRATTTDLPQSIMGSNDSPVSQFHCCDCSRDFFSEDALGQHLRDKVHKYIECQICQQTLGGLKSLESHVVKVHGASAMVKRTLYPEKYNACYICQRKFINKGALYQHLNSLLHHPLSDLRCIASSKCKARFTSPSALLNHLESGSCRSGLSRQEIHKLVQIHDTERTISKGPPAPCFIDVRAEWSDSSSSSAGTPVMTPTSSALNSPTLTGVQAIDSLIPTFQSLSNTHGHASASRLLPNEHQVSAKSPLKCPLCPNNNKLFRNPAALQSHLSSPIHAPKPFHCPSNVPHLSSERTPVKHFSTLGGLAQHIESGVCGDGAETMRKAIELVQGKLENMGFRGLRLLK